MATLEKPKTIVKKGVFKKYPNLNPGELFILEEKTSKLNYAFTTLSTYSDFPNQINFELNESNEIKFLFVEIDCKLDDYRRDMIFTAVQNCPVVVSFIEDKSVPARVIYAWTDGAEQDTIAWAKYYKTEKIIVIVDAALNVYKLEIGCINKLSRLSDNEIQQFKIHEFGHYIRWPKIDLHITLDDVKCIVDPEFRMEKVLNTLSKSSKYGQAIRSLREQCKLTKIDIQKKTGLSERQIRRYENEGYNLTSEAVEKLSNAHGMTGQEYLDKLADLVNSI